MDSPQLKKFTINMRCVGVNVFDVVDGCLAANVQPQHADGELPNAQNADSKQMENTQNVGSNRL